MIPHPVSVTRPAYPLLLDVADRLVVIVGGGAVAVRKAKGVLEAGARRVRCIAPDFHPELPAAVDRVPEPYEPRHLDGAGLAFACTDSADVNDAVCRDCRARGILVNRADADDEQPGDFTVPAKFRQGPVTVTVSVGSPALAAFIRDRLTAAWDPRWAAMAEAMRVLRPQIVASGLSPRERARAFARLASEEALDLLARGGLDELTNTLLPELRPPPPPEP